MEPDDNSRKQMISIVPGGPASRRLFHAINEAYQTRQVEPPYRIAAIRANIGPIRAQIFQRINV